MAEATAEVGTAAEATAAEERVAVRAAVTAVVTAAEATAEVGTAAEATAVVAMAMEARAVVVMAAAAMVVVEREQGLSSCFLCGKRRYSKICLTEMQSNRQIARTPLASFLCQKPSTLLWRALTTQSNPRDRG